jgi:hypothetical protein
MIPVPPSGGLYVYDPVITLDNSNYTLPYKPILGTFSLLTTHTYYIYCGQIAPPVQRWRSGALASLQLIPSSEDPPTSRVHSHSSDPDTAPCSCAKAPTTLPSTSSTRRPSAAGHSHLNLSSSRCFAFAPFALDPI